MRVDCLDHLGKHRITNLSLTLFKCIWSENVKLLLSLKNIPLPCTIIGKFKYSFYVIPITNRNCLAFNILKRVPVRSIENRLFLKFISAGRNWKFISNWVYLWKISNSTLFNFACRDRLPTRLSHNIREFQREHRHSKFFCFFSSLPNKLQGSSTVILKCRWWTCTCYIFCWVFFKRRNDKKIVQSTIVLTLS